MAKKKKGFFSAVGSFLGSIPAVGKVKKAAKKVTKKAKKAVKSAKKKIKAKKKKLKAKVKKAAKKLKKKAKKKIGKVFTKARKIKNNLSKSKMVKKIKKTMKKAVLSTKKAAKKVKKAAKAAVKVVKKVAKKAVVAAKNMDLKQAISTAADFIPVVSNAKAIYEATVGKDPFTGRKLEAWERGASAASILGGPIVKGIKHGGKAAAGIIKNSGKSTKKPAAATKPKATTTPSQKKQENKPKPNTTPAPAVNKKQTTSTPHNGNKPAAAKQQGTGDIGTPPRYGERRISQTLYNELRDKTPTEAIRKEINKDLKDKLGQPDPALPGKYITDTLQADHIVSMKNIARMENFDKLTKEQQLKVLNNPDNFIGLSETANKSKGSKSYEEWTIFKKENIKVDSKFREEMMKREKQLEMKLQKQIDDFIEKTDKDID